MKKTSKKFDIFLSYASTDRRIADRLYSILSKEVSVFYDVNTLAPGDQWDYELARAQRTSLMSVFIITDATPAVFYSREEVAAAISTVRPTRDMQRVVPVYVGQRTDYKARLPYGLREVQAMHAESEQQLEPVARQLLIMLAHLKDERSLQESSNTSSISNLPARTGTFLGREAVLSELSLALSQPLPERPVAVLGSGGVGKSQLALEYSHRHQKEFAISWWVRAHDADLLLRDLSALSVRLGLPVVDDLDRVSHSVINRLMNFGSSWIVLFDDLTDYSLIHQWLDRPIRGGVVITSRVRPPNRFEANVTIVPLDGLDLNSAVEFLIKQTGKQDPVGASRLASHLRGFPLALQLAAGQIKQSDVSFEEYDQILRSYRFGERNDLVANLAFPILQLRTEHPSAYLLLERLSLLGNAGTPLWLFEGDQEPGFSTRELSEAVEVLKAQGVVVVEGSAIALVHVLVKEQVMSEMSDADTRIRRKELLDLLLWGFPAEPEDPDTWPRSSELLPHTLILSESADSDTFERVLLLLDRAARFSVSRANLLQAGEILDISAALAKRFLGDDDLSTRSILGNVAVNLRAKGNVREALQLQERLLDRYMTLDGRNSVNTLSAMSNLADTLRYTGQLVKARRLQQEVLDGYLHILGREDSLTARAMNNLAGTLSLLGEYSESCLLQERLVAVLSRTLGLDDLATIRAISNLAMTHKSLGKLDEALRLQRDVCNRLVASLGDGHPDTLANISNLAGTLIAQGSVQEAKFLYEKVLAGYISLYGQRHPETLSATSNLAYVMALSGNLSEALEIDRKVLAQYIELMGEDHPSTLNVTNNLADVLGKLGRLQEAQELIQRVVDGTRRVFGDDYPLVLTSKNNLATVLFRMGDVESARLLCEEVLKARTRVLGADHPDTKLSAQNLAAVSRAAR